MRLLESGLGKLAVRDKFLLLGVAALVAIAVPGWKALGGLYAQWQVAEGEITGTPPARAVLDVLVEVRETRGLNALVVRGDAAALPQRDAAIIEADKAIAALEAAFAGREQFVEAPTAL